VEEAVAEKEKEGEGGAKRRGGGGGVLTRRERGGGEENLSEADEVAHPTPRSLPPRPRGT